MSALEGQAPARRPVLAAFRSPLLMIFLLALAARTARILVSGGFLAPQGYDPGVYYAGAAGLVNGKIPYRDFSFVHPPGIALLESPFALLGRFTTDLTGYAAATAFIITMASASAVLVVLVARALGLSDRAAITGGAVYALWTNAVAFEFTGRLEPVGNFFVLLGLLAFHRALVAAGRRADRLLALAGLAVGAAIAVKLWWVVPIGVFAAWYLLVERRVRALVAVAAGAVVTLVVVNLPFLLLARGAMWDSIVRDQLGRDPNDVPREQVFSYLVVGGWSADRSASFRLAVVAVGIVVLAVVARRSWRTPAARPLLAVLLAQLAQLWFQPIWYPFYSDFPTVALCLLVAAAFGVAPARHTRRAGQTWLRRTWLPTALVTALAVNTTWFLATWEAGPDASPTPVPRAALTAALADVRCVTSDQPMGLIQVDALSRSFQNDCPEWVDIVGRKLRFNRLVGPPRVPGNPTTWDHLVARHLRKSDALLLTRKPEDIGLFPPTFEKLQRYGLVVEVGGYSVYRMPGRR